MKDIVGRVRRAHRTIVSARPGPRRNPTHTPPVGLRGANPTYQLHPSLGQDLIQGSGSQHSFGPAQQGVGVGRFDTLMDGGRQVAEAQA